MAAPVVASDLGPVARFPAAVGDNLHRTRGWQLRSAAGAPLGIQFHFGRQ